MLEGWSVLREWERMKTKLSHRFGSRDKSHLSVRMISRIPRAWRYSLSRGRNFSPNVQRGCFARDRGRKLGEVYPVKERRERDRSTFFDAKQSCKIWHGTIQFARLSFAKTLGWLASSKGGRRGEIETYGRIKPVRFDSPRRETQIAEQLARKIMPSGVKQREETRANRTVSRIGDESNAKKDIYIYIFSTRRRKQNFRTKIRNY